MLELLVKRSYVEAGFKKMIQKFEETGELGVIARKRKGTDFK